MSSHLTVEEMLRQCAHSMSGTFTRQDVFAWFRRHFPDAHEQTVGTLMHAMTSNAKNREQNHPHHGSLPPLFDRVGHGLYRVHQPEGSETVTTSAASLPPPRATGVTAAPPGPTPSARQEWWWEGNVQSAVVDFLVREGWSVTRVADTASKEHGTDVEAVREGRRLHVEAKGWPSAQYVDTTRAHEKKKTMPATQARVWFADAVVHTLRLRAAHPVDTVAIAFPSNDTYRRLWEGIRGPMLEVGIAVLWVAEDGSVDHDGWDPSR